MTKSWEKILLVILISGFVFTAATAQNYPPLKPSSPSYFANTWYHIFSPASFLLPPHFPKKVIYETKSDYNEIRVYEDEEGWRYLVFLPENGIQSAYDTKNPNNLILQYSELCFLALPALGREPEKVLFVGMGGAIMPTYFRRYYSEVKIDIVDIDGAIPAVAETFFNFKPDSNTKVYLEDGRKFIEDSDTNYDIIFLDVYDADTIPPQFTTAEFFNIVKEKLRSDGVLSLNLANFSDDFVNRVHVSVKSAFPNTYSFLAENTRNYVLISLKDNSKNFNTIEMNAQILDEENIFNIHFQEMLKKLTTVNK